MVADTEILSERFASLPCLGDEPVAAADLDASGIDSGFVTLPEVDISDAVSDCVGASPEKDVDIDDVFKSFSSSRPGRWGPTTPFVGDLHRSPAHMHWLRSRKEMQTMQRGLKRHLDCWSGLSRAWNPRCFRWGDKVPEGIDSATKKGKSTKKSNRPHPNQWDIGSVLMCGFKAVGRKIDREGMQGTHGSMDAIGTVAGLAETAISEKVGSFHKQELCHGGVSAPVIVVGYDATPMRLRFGKMQALLAPLARYAVRADDNKWQMVSMEELQRKYPKKAMLYGHLEVFAQKVSIHYCQGADSDIVMQKAIPCPPRILQKANASCYLNAVRSAQPELCGEGLVELCRHQKVVLYTEAPDSASSNVRMSLETAARLPSNCLHTWAPCGCHQVHRVMVIATQEEAIIGDVHAIAVACSSLSHQAKLLAAARRLVDEEFDWLHTPPHPAAYAHHSAVLDESLFRTSTVIRGRLVNGISEKPARDEARIQECKLALLAMANGDWTRPRLQHHCQGCCATEEEAKEKLFGALVLADLLLLADCKVPAKSRWGTCTEKLGKSLPHACCTSYSQGRWLQHLATRT